jgi:hypothetical protein
VTSAGHGAGARAGLGRKGREATWRGSRGRRVRHPRLAACGSR